MSCMQTVKHLYLAGLTALVKLGVCHISIATHVRTSPMTLGQVGTCEENGGGEVYKKGRHSTFPFI